MKIFVTGDTHQNIDIAKLNSRNFPIGKTLTKEDVVIILGDAGFVWDNSAEEKYWRQWLNDKPWTTFCVLGNHENYNLIEQLPETQMFGNTVKQVENSIFYANTGLVYNIGGYKCLVVNGADSHDKEYRKENISWWSQERITQDDAAKAVISLAQVNDEIDYLFTHTGGSEVCRSFGFIPTPSDFWIDHIIGMIKGNFKHYCGHYHTDLIVNEYTKMLYRDIILLHDTEDEINDGGLCSIFNGIRLDGSTVIEFE